MPRSPRANHASTALISEALASQYPTPKRAKTTPAKVVPIRPGIQMPIAFTVYGDAKGKGSGTVQWRHGKPVYREGKLGGKTPEERERNKERTDGLYAWYDTIADEAQVASDFGRLMLDGPLQVAAKIWIEPTAKSHVPGDWHTVPFDLDKHFRAIGDSLKKGGAIREDARICTWDGSWKRFCRPGESARVEIEIIPLRPPIDMEHA